MLTFEQRKRVAEALDARGGSVDGLQTPEEFHQFVLHYNPNDGLLPLWAIAKHENCDKATALSIYWLLEDCVLERESLRGRKDPRWDGVGLIEEIEGRYSDGLYTQSTFRFSPTEWLNWSPTKVRLVAHRHGGALPFPEIMLQSIEGEVVQREDLP